MGRATYRLVVRMFSVKEQEQRNTWALSVRANYENKKI